MKNYYKNSYVTRSTVFVPNCSLASIQRQYLPFYMNPHHMHIRKNPIMKAFKLSVYRITLNLGSKQKRESVNYCGHMENNRQKNLLIANQFQISRSPFPQRIIIKHRYHPVLVMHKNWVSVVFGPVEAIERILYVMSFSANWCNNRNSLQVRFIRQQIY